MKDLHDYRKSYERYELTEANVPQHPIALFGTWFADADASKTGEANAMTLSTLGRDDFPNNRIVLLKEFGEKGFTFFTNYDSDKGKAIAMNPNVCLSFFWQQQERQVIIKGKAVKVTEAESEAYFSSRPKGSQLGAVASHQSEILPNRELLEARLSELEKEFENRPVPRPENWGGYTVEPESVEFWQGRPNRLHDRIRYRFINGNWTMERLSP